MTDAPVTVHGRLYADPALSREERAHFILVLRRHHEVAVVADDRLARHVMAAFRAGDPMTVTGFIEETDWWSSGTRRAGRQRVLRADSIIRFAPRSSEAAA